MDEYDVATCFTQSPIITGFPPKATAYNADIVKLDRLVIWRPRLPTGTIPYEFYNVADTN